MSLIHISTLNLNTIAVKRPWRGGFTS